MSKKQEWFRKVINWVAACLQTAIQLVQSSMLGYENIIGLQRMKTNIIHHSDSGCHNIISGRKWDKHDLKLTSL